MTDAATARSRPAFRVRPATDGDEPFVVDAAARLAAFPLPPWRTEADVVGAETRGLREAFASGRHRDDLLVAVGEPDGEPLGFVYLERLVDYFTGRPHGHVSMLVVVPAAEGRGIATALLRAADDWGRTNGYPWLTLNVFEGNGRARALYERLGYRPETLRYLRPL